VGRGDTFGLRLMAASPLDGEAQRLQLGDSAVDVVDGWLRFSPDGRKLLVWAYPGLYVNSRERINPFWVIDWPARTSHGAFASVALILSCVRTVTVVPASIAPNRCAVATLENDSVQNMAVAVSTDKDLFNRPNLMLFIFFPPRLPYWQTFRARTTFSHQCLTDRRCNRRSVLGNGVEPCV